MVMLQGLLVQFIFTSSLLTLFAATAIASVLESIMNNPQNGMHLFSS